MRRRTVPALAVLLLSAAPIAAQAEPVTAIVYGLANGDLLNVRATPSPVGLVLGRLPNGAPINTQGCRDVNGYSWCKVEDPENPAMTGWTPARYLQPASMSGSFDELAADADTAAAPVTAAGAVPVSPDPLDDITAGANGENLFVPGGPPEAASAQPGTGNGAAEVSVASLPDGADDAPAPVAVPLDLSARLGEHGGQAAETGGKTADIGTEGAQAIARAAIEDAYGLAFAARENPTTGATPDPQGSEPLAAGIDEPRPAISEDIPLPTARPGDDPAIAAPEAPSSQPLESRPVVEKARAEPVQTPEPAPAGQRLAMVEPVPEAARQAVAGEIPCARYLGQPMTRCAVAIVRSAADAAEVTVSWPDGGSRIVSFREGKPSGADARGEFRFTREGGLNMIRVGAAERFEITDSLAFGD